MIALVVIILVAYLVIGMLVGKIMVRGMAKEIPSPLERYDHFMLAVVFIFFTGTWPLLGLFWLLSCFGKAITS